MSITASRSFELTEYQPKKIARSALNHNDGLLLWQEYGKYVSVDFPSPQTGGDWRLRANGWVGTLPVSPDLQLALVPKVPIANLFRMLEVAYRLNLRIFPSLTGAASLEDFFERLACILAKRVLDRCRKGLYRSYLPRREHLPYLRGRLELQQHLQRPWDVALPCRFEEHTADLEDNQILAWTLARLTRSSACSERILPVVRRSYRALQGLVTHQPITAQVCVGRLYNRLNEDYEPMHALCRFFLEHTGPTHERGDRQNLPFLVGMADLFELFVAEWLKTNLPTSLSVTAQEKVHIGDENGLDFEIDLVLYTDPGRQPLAVLDTKYKAVTRASTTDVSQVVTYAELIGCQHAFLIYPDDPAQPLDVKIGDIQVQSLVFLLGEDLESAGIELRRRLLSSMLRA